MGLSFNSNVENIGLILNLVMLVLSIILYFVDFFKSKRIIIVFAGLWSISMLLFYYIKKDQLDETYKNRGGLLQSKEKLDESDNNYLNHNELYFHLSLVSYYIYSIVAGFYLYFYFKK